MSIAVKQLQKRFGQFTALDNVSLEFPDGELTALLGPSGCGKTTLLRIIAGLEYADQGQILLDGQDASQQHVRERQVGFVFQHYALFKHMTIFENIAFGLRVNRAPSVRVRRRSKKKSPSYLSWCSLTGWQIAIRHSYLVVSVNVLHWPAPWLLSLVCCYWMNRLVRWMRRSVKSCVAGCVVCMMICM